MFITKPKDERKKVHVKFKRGLLKIISYVVLFSICHFANATARYTNFGYKQEEKSKELKKKKPSQLIITSLWDTKTHFLESESATEPKEDNEVEKLKEEIEKEERKKEEEEQTIRESMLIAARIYHMKMNKIPLYIVIPGSKKVSIFVLLE